MDALKKSLREDSFVNLYIGTTPSQQSFRAPPNYRIPASLLVNVSTRLEKLIKKHRTSQPAKEVNLHFSDDDVEVWGPLLYYAQFRKLPPEIEDDKLSYKLLVDAWILGHKYEVFAFQDLVMLELLAHLRYNGHTNIPLIEYAFAKTPQGSVMRTLMAEEAVYLRYETNAIGNDDLDRPAQVFGFTSEFWKALEKYRKIGSVLFERFDEEAKEEDRRMLWREFMVDEGPRVHWVYEEESSGMR